MKKVIQSLSVALFVLSIGAAAHAGSKEPWPVTVSTSSHWAEGALGDARNSSDSNQFIGCSVNNGQAYCAAQDASGTYVSCVTTATSFLNALNSLNGGSALYFAYNTSGVCSSLIVYNYSYFSQKGQ
jgi:hypothetical protein